MKSMEWSATYNVGIKEIDMQHKKLFEMINTFNDALNKGDSNAPKILLIDLMEYALKHFRTEEKYFKEFDYADSQVHIIEHTKFENTISEFRTSYQSNKTFNTTIVLEYLKTWIINHILINDKKYIKCFHKNGLS